MVQTPFLSLVYTSGKIFVGVFVSHKNIRNGETARGQLMTYTRQFIVPHPWNNPIFSYPTYHPYPYSDPIVF